MDKLNLLGNVELRDFKDYPIEIEATATPFHFNDLSTFIEATDFLRGNAHFDLKATGYFGDFDVSKLSVAFKNSDMQLNGNVKNLHIPSKLFFDVKATSNKLVESEIFDLVEGLQIPRYENLIAEKLSLSYKGEPTKFKANLTGNVNDGKIFLDTYLDLQKEKMEYDIKFATEKINVFPIVGFNSSITGNGSLKGIGTDTEDMDANFIIDAKSSTLYDIKLDSLKLVSQINSKIFNLDFNALVNNAKTSVKGILDLRNSENPTYDLNGATNNFNLQTFTNNKSDSSNLNFAFMAKGTNLNLDKLIGEFEIKLEPSQLRELKLDETNIKLSLKKEEELRKINLVSEFVDFNINGNFSLEKAIELLTYEGKTISYLISKKIDELNPIEDDGVKNTMIEMAEISPIVNESVEFNYDFTFKDFNLIAIFLKNDELDISGSGTGNVKNDSLQFRISTEIDIQNLLNKKDSLLLYLSDSKANLNFSRDNQEISFNKIFGSVSLEGDKIYAGAELNDVQADFIFNQSKLFFNTSLGVGENLTTEMEGTISTFAADEEIRFNAITLNYKNIPWASFDTSSVIFTGSGIQLSNLILENANALVTVNGQINNDESHNFFVEIENLPGEILSSYFANENDNPLKGDVNLNFSSTGFLTEPELNGDISFNEIAYN
ncbi:MAG: hypothetical protein KDC67_11870, partial [Ignavibacteriae bacterium]|nr:hypothetical protein [Ignavibacteriota bacterium]